mmetsp:Transcript_19402/g.49942  ORF Transcript_19402/g.49942 Transcript_19402/m.49942 type:complete len:95 (+) Transcript_19402:3-287(+)
MDDLQVARVIATCPSPLGFNLDKSLKPKVNILQEQGFAKSQIVSCIARFPQLLSYSSTRLAHRVSILDALGLLTERSLCNSMSLTDAKFAARFE